MITTKISGKRFQMKDNLVATSKVIIVDGIPNINQVICADFFILIDWLKRLSTHINYYKLDNNF